MYSILNILTGDVGAVGVVGAVGAPKWSLSHAKLDVPQQVNTYWGVFVLEFMRAFIYGFRLPCQLHRLPCQLHNCVTENRMPDARKNIVAQIKQLVALHGGDKRRVNKQ